MNKFAVLLLVLCVGLIGCQAEKEDPILQPTGPAVGAPVDEAVEATEEAAEATEEAAEATEEAAEATEEAAEATEEAAEATEEPADAMAEPPAEKPAE